MKARYLAFVAAAFCVGASHTSAQEDQPPPYDKGPVWSFAEVKTKDGHFDDYMKFLDTDWKPRVEAFMKAGRLLGYKVFVVDSPRKDEGDIWLAVELPNMAALDHSTAEDYALDKQIVGSIAKLNQAFAARGSMRENIGEILVREMTLK